MRLNKPNKSLNKIIEKHEDAVINALMAGLVLSGGIIGYSIGSSVENWKFRKAFQALFAVKPEFRESVISACKEAQRIYKH